MNEAEAKALAEQVAKLIVKQVEETLGNGNRLSLNKYLGRASLDWEWFLDKAVKEELEGL